jgi:uncharacterized protein YceK
MKKIFVLAVLAGLGGCASQSATEAEKQSAADPQAGLRAAQQGAAKAQQEAQAAAAARANQQR